MNTTKQLIAIVLISFLFLSTPANAFSINELKIEVQDNGDANVSAKYSLSWWESFLLWISGIFGEGGEQIEGYIENQLGREVSSFKIEKDGEASFTIEDYTGKVNREEGTWYWTTFYLSEDACDKINLGTVTIIFPDGFIYEFDRKLPNLQHLENEEFAKMYIEAKCTKDVYESIAPLYFLSTYSNRLLGSVIKLPQMSNSKIFSTITIFFTASQLPHSEFTTILDLKELIELTSADIDNKIEEFGLLEINRMAEIAKLSIFSLESSAGPMLGWYIKDMVELKEEEMNLIYTMVSNPEEYQQIELLKKNLERQEKKLNAIKEESTGLQDIVYFSTASKEIKEYGRTLLNYASDLADIDLKHVNHALITIEENYFSERTLPQQTGCGNGICEMSEDCNSCPEDCGCPAGEYCSKIGICMPVTCGDEVCSPGEEDTCCEDCGCPEDKICNKFTQTCQGKPAISDERVMEIVNDYMNKNNIDGTITISDVYYKYETVKQVNINCETYGIVLFINDRGKIVEEFRTT